MPAKLKITARKDPVASARAAGLRYANDDKPGIRRVRRGRAFGYVDARGKPVKSSDLKRIRSLVIPPAWTGVWICPDPQGHLQATGRDARGRKQYRYHPKWREVRDGTKYGRLIQFGRALPAIRRRTDADLRRAGLPREKVLAAVVKLLEKTFIRVGNDEYARTNRSFGLTTMRDGHVKVSGSKVKFIFRGKSGVAHDLELDDRRLAKMNIVSAIEQVAKRLGNTRAVCRKCYVHPAILDAYLDGSMLKTVALRAGRATRAIGRMTESEAVVLGLLQRRLAKASGRTA